MGAAAAAAPALGITTSDLSIRAFLNPLLTAGYEVSLKVSWKKIKQTMISSYFPQCFWICVYSILFWFSYLALILFLKQYGFRYIYYEQTPAPNRSFCTSLTYRYAYGNIEKINPGNYQPNSTENNHQKSFHLELSGCFQVKDFILPWLPGQLPHFATLLC